MKPSSYLALVFSFLSFPLACVPGPSQEITPTSTPNQNRETNLSLNVRTGDSIVLNALDLLPLPKAQYTWSQVSGPSISIPEPHASRLEFVVPFVPNPEFAILSLLAEGEGTEAKIRVSLGIYPQENRDNSPTCTDGMQNGSEAGIDCGGGCAPCPTAPTCDDGIQNGDEAGTDCGGDCEPCSATSTCEDEIQNGNETGIDCGGDCEPCPAAPTCDDGVQNGNETGIDCDGDCEPCPTAPTCSDGIQNGDETGTDCGGSCPTCPEESGGPENPQILAQQTNIPGTKPDPADNPNNTVVHVDCPAYPANCAPSINNAISANTARPLKVTFGDPNNSIKVRFSSTITLRSNVSIEGLGQPDVERPSSPTASHPRHKMFILSNTQNVSVRGFDLNLAACRVGDAVFFDTVAGPSDGKSNIHISHIRTYNGSYFWREPQGRWWLRVNNTADCDFLRLQRGGTDIHVHHVAAIDMRKWVFLANGQFANVFIFDNNVTLMNKGYYSQFAGATMRNLRIQSNVFSKIARGHGNFEGSAQPNMLEFRGSGTPGVINTQDVVILDNVIELPWYVGHEETSDDRLTDGNGNYIRGTVGGQDTATIVKAMLHIQSMEDFRVQNNIFRQDTHPTISPIGSHHGLVIGDIDVRDGEVTGNTFSGIAGQPTVAPPGLPPSVVVQQP